MWAWKPVNPCVLRGWDVPQRRSLSVCGKEEEGSAVTGTLGCSQGGGHVQTHPAVLAHLTPPSSRQALGEGLKEEGGESTDAFAGSC